MKRFVDSLGLRFISISLSECAAGVDRVRLYDTLTYRPLVTHRADYTDD